MQGIECPLRKLVGIAHVQELRFRELFVGIAGLHQAGGRGNLEFIGIRRFLIADLVDLEIERHGALADTQCSERMKYLGGFSFRKLAQRHQQIIVDRQLGLPVFDLVEFGAQQRHDGDRRQGRIFAIPPGDIEVGGYIEKEQAECAGSMRAPGSGTFERELEPDAEQPQAEYLE